MTEPRTPVSVGVPHRDDRNRRRPFVVVLRKGTTHSIIEVHRFRSPRDAWAFYEEHKP